MRQGLLGYKYELKLEQAKKTKQVSVKQKAE